MEEKRFAEVIVPLALKGSFTYRIPAQMQLQIGCRVLVQFGQRKIYTGIVCSLHGIEPEGFKTKDILGILDSCPIVVHPQLKFWSWIADYYLCTIGEVFKAALPAGLKVESEQFVDADPDFEVCRTAKFTEKELTILNIVTNMGRVQVAQITKATGFKGVEREVGHLVEKGALHISESVVESYRPQTVTYVALTIEREDKAGLELIFEQTKRSAKQQQLLLAYLDLSGWFRISQPLQLVTKDELRQKVSVSQATYRLMITKGYLREEKCEINRFANSQIQTQPLPELSQAQTTAYRQIHQLFATLPTVLLHGVTGSGKTAVYMHLIADALRERKQVLYLVPEIALTTQLTKRLFRVFGDKVLVYHSKFSDNERVDIWKRLLGTKDPMVIVGVRSSVFLPFHNLGLIIIDEEHDGSYKQQSPAPRYNARNAALYLAQMHGAKAVLGSATPAVETFYNAQTVKFGLVTLTTRYAPVEMPEVTVVDTKLARKRKEVRGMFTRSLIKRCYTALDANEQVILFQNRRGYSPLLRCKECGAVPRCINCDVSLTYHRGTNSLTCHYCGYTISTPTVCPACGLPALEVSGYGTERVEDEVEQIFPGRKIARMDLDTTRGKNSYEKIIDDFSEHKTDILVGTQMVTKGLDFDQVSIVGILNADNLISFPDFRSHERAFQTLEQVSGRAGRMHKSGQVVIQTSEPEHPIIKLVQQHDYGRFVERELRQRKQFFYPPFSRVINIYIKHQEQSVVELYAQQFAVLLRQVFDKRVLGPERPLVAKVQNMHIRQLTLKMELEASMQRVKDILRKLYVHLLQTDARAKRIVIYYDVDPN